MNLSLVSNPIKIETIWPIQALPNRFRLGLAGQSRRRRPSDSVAIARRSRRRSAPGATIGRMGSIGTLARRLHVDLRRQASSICPVAAA